MDRTQADIQALGQTKKLAPKVTDFIGRKGFSHRQEKRSDGVVEDVVSWTPNLDGKKTNAAHEVEEATGAFGAAEMVRATELQGRIERETLTDADGGVRQVAASMAEDAAKRNGWKPRIRVRGKRVAMIDQRGNFVRCE